MAIPKSDLVETKEILQESVWIEIHLGHLEKNLENLHRLVGPKVKILAVVKSNAYGHGLREISRFLAPQVDFLGVANLREAQVIRESVPATPILIFGALFAEEAAKCLIYDLSVTLSSLEQAESLNRQASMFGKALKVHVKVDSGMGRMGLVFEEALETIPKIAEMSHLSIEGLMTHFPVADEPSNPFTEEQIQKFSSLIERLERGGIRIPLKHAANSAGLLGFKNAHFNMVRPGISLYGIYPAKEAQRKIPLAPVLSLKARVHLVKKLPKGHSVSYGRHFRLVEEGYIAVLPVGYGLGYPFALSGKSRVLIRGKTYPVSGNVCMDHTVIFIGKEKEVEVGDEAVLIGAQGEDLISVEELAEKSSTLTYEILTQLSPMIERRYEK